MAYLEQLLRHVDSLDNLEVEMSLLMNPQQFRAPRFVKYKNNVSETIDFAKKVAKLKGKRSVVQSVNFITNGDKQFIKRLVFVDGVQDKSKLTYQTKERFTSVFLTSKDSIDAKLNMSFEMPAKKEDRPVDVVRFKLRLSIIPKSGFDGWRIDLTLVKEEKGNVSVGKLKTLRDGLFVKGLTVDNFAEEAPWEFADRVEIEIERNNSKGIKVHELRVVDELVRAVSGFDYVQYIAEHLRANVTSNTAGFKRMGNQVIELTKSIFLSDMYPRIDNTWMTDKADGLRAFVVFEGGVAKVITSTNLEGILLKAEFSGRAIADAEYFADDGVYLFDVIMFEGKNMAGRPFEERMPLLEKLSDDSNVMAKEYVKLDGDYGKKMKAALKKRRPYDIDGLIFTAGGDNYRQTKNYKWKPLNKMTIDFLAVECPPSLLGVSPFIKKPGKILHLLFSYINPRKFEALGLTFIRDYKKMFPQTDPSYFPVQFSPSSDPHAYLFWHNKSLDRQIVELGRDKEWKFYRVRDDKDKPNDFRIAELTFQNYFNPLTLEDMSNVAKGYFQEDDSKLHEGSRHFNSFVKSKLIERYGTNSPWVMDLAGGKGQDLFRYAKVGVKNLIYLEIDKDGITEIINRKHSVKGVRVYTVEADLTAAPKTNIKKVEAVGLQMKGGIPLIVCNFAIHYLIKTSKHVKQLLDFIKHFLEPGGRFIFTAFDGKTVFDMLKKTDRWQWDVMEGEVLKYSIKREFRSNEMTPTNQKIGVKLPFSGDAYYSEYLVNNAYLEKAWKGVMKRVEFGSFSEYLETYAKENQRGYAGLSRDDKKFVSLYHYAVYQMA